MADAPTLFFDLGGVLLTNGWDTGARQRAAATFGLDFPEFQTRHEMLKTAFETGRLSLNHYVNKAVFHRERDFDLKEFREFMFAQSQLLGDTLDFVRALARTGRYRLYTLNNESRELHEHRVRAFGLDEVFRGFLASCYLGQVKPDEDIYLNALGIAATGRDHAVFIDDRPLNVEPALALGLNGYHFRGLDGLRDFLKDRGIVA
jgi:putative hydrolase of the HAD superfamily